MNTNILKNLKLVTGGLFSTFNGNELHSIPHIDFEKKPSNKPIESQCFGSQAAIL